MLTGRVAEASVVLQFRLADQDGAGATVGPILVARHANVVHAFGAVGRADAAARVVEALVALGVPEAGILLAAIALLGLARAAAVIFGLLAVVGVITPVGGAILQAAVEFTRVAFIAKGVAERLVILLVRGAG
jgi:hypothetical protein